MSSYAGTNARGRQGWRTGSGCSDHAGSVGYRVDGQRPGHFKRDFATAAAIAPTKPRRTYRGSKRGGHPCCCANGCKVAVVCRVAEVPAQGAGCLDAPPPAQQLRSGSGRHIDCGRRPATGAGESSLNPSGCNEATWEDTPPGAAAESCCHAAKAEWAALAGT